LPISSDIHGFKEKLQLQNRSKQNSLLASRLFNSASRKSKSKKSKSRIAREETDDPKSSKEYAMSGEILLLTTRMTLNTKSFNFI